MNAYTARLKDLRNYVARSGRLDALRPIDRALRALEVPPCVQDRVAAALAETHPRLAPVLNAPDVPVLCPAYPNAPRVVQARLALGEAPVRVLRGLKPHEAHEALATGYGDPVTWLVRGTFEAEKGTLERRIWEWQGNHPNDVAIARWLLACRDDPARRAALEAERCERIAGVEVRGRLLDRLDEIRAVDLDHGTRTSVRRAFDRAARRSYAEWEQRAQDDQDVLAPAPRWWRPVRCVRLLRTRAALVAEGRALNHCVGTYAPAVAQRRCVIVSIAIRVGANVYRSTAELSPQTAEVWQHRGPGNREPHPLCQRALEVLSRRWQRTPNKRGDET